MDDKRRDKDVRLMRLENVFKAGSGDSPEPASFKLTTITCSYPVIRVLADYCYRPAVNR